MGEKKFKKLSIITPFYNEEQGIQAYFDALIPILKEIDEDYEIICIDDGSIDNTFLNLMEWHKKDENIQVIKLSRNFGKEAALTAGLDIATGDAVIPMDADLQEPPEQIPNMLNQWHAGYDVVLMKRSSRDEGFLKKITARAFYCIINWLTAENIPEEVGDFRLMDKKVVSALNKLREKNRFMKGILSWGGFRTTTLLFDRPERVIGDAKQNWKKLFQLAFNGIFSFSSFPLKIFLFIGVFISIFSFIYGLFIILKKIFFGDPVAGYASMMTVILFLNGLLMVGVGILGEYIGRIFDEVKNRPIYIIDEHLK